MQFDVVGDRDPFLMVRLNQGESLFAESGAMVAMSDTLDLAGAIRGGVLSGMARKLVAGESLFTQHTQATRGPGEILLAPALPGDVQVLTVDAETQYLLADGAFLAAEDGVQLTMRMQSQGNALFGGTGGFFVVEAKGRGQLAIAGFGSVFCQEVQPGADLVIDNQHVVAWDSNLTYSVNVGTNRSKGFLSNMVGAATSGEGLVTRFSGRGKAYIASRSLSSLRAAVSSSAASTSADQKAFLAQAAMPSLQDLRS